ncbi:MAG TPA: Gfo/Idh/MocA family oxidoreductase [Tepidisphaeraceae bacterium]|nr:Gfo/Idh/MocA family oxidoreductase [Tepidisphaeraceae bacterium]
MRGAQHKDATTNASLSRRSMLKATAAASALAATGALGTNFAHAQGSMKIRVGLIGCGGRGNGAARDCAGPNENVQIVALGDVFQERIDKAKQQLADLGEKFAVTDDNCFVGFDAYKKVIDSDVDLVIFATPPGFRPMHIAAAVDAGKHIFAEKPVAVDPAGVRSVLESAKKIKEKKLGFVCGTQRRHHAGYIQTIERIHDGAIGEVVGGQCYWNQAGLWMHPRQESWSDMEWQLRNWLYFTWLSGDHIVEQHVHNLDVMNWVMNATPVSAYGMGGRQARTDPAYGHIYDHFAVEYVYPNGTRIMSMARQQDGTDTRVGENVVGTKGTSNPSAGQITGPNALRLRAPEGGYGEYQQEHIDLINSIRSGNPLNEAETIAQSTLTAIMGRMSAYTGKLVTWEQALNSKLDLVPTSFAMGPMPVPPVPIPGKEQSV